MGTDIHSIAQVRTPITRFSLLEVDEQPSSRLPGAWKTVAIGVAGDPRSYNTFAMLADVRNGTGFAGIKTSDGFPVIHEQRGLPDDLVVEDDHVAIKVSDLVAAWDWDGNLVSVESAEARRVRYLDMGSTMWLGEHSQSWCTLKELKTFIDNVASKFEACIHGVVNVEEYRAAKADGREFNSWCGAISGPGVVVVDESQIDDVKDATHIQAAWTRNAVQSSWLRQIVAALEVVAKHCNVSDDDVRFIYGFDS